MALSPTLSDVALQGCTGFLKQGGRGTVGGASVAHQRVFDSAESRLIEGHV